MRYFTIEVDEIIMDILKNNAEPFDDTPNSVLHRLLSNQGGMQAEKLDKKASFTGHIPKSLSQILEVVSEVKKFGRTRQDATRIVAKRNNTTPQTIIDKYCRQLGKKANEFDMLLNEPGLRGLNMILSGKYSNHRQLISDFFNDLGQSDSTSSEPSEEIRQVRTHRIIRPATSSTSPIRKKRDTALEAAIKKALGDQLKAEFGDFVTKGQSQLVFNNTRVLCKYSSFHNDQSRWFWGVSKIYWQHWQENDYLALIFENDVGNQFSYLLLDSDEAKRLFGYCSESNGEKKINMRIYADDDKVRFQEWKGFDIQERTRTLNLD